MSSILFRTLSVCWALPATTLFNAVCCHCLPDRRNAEFLNSLAASRPTEAMMSPVYTGVKVVSVLCGPATCQPPWSNGPRKREMLRRRNRGFRTKEGTVFKNTLKVHLMHLNNSLVIFIFRNYTAMLVIQQDNWWRCSRRHTVYICIRKEKKCRNKQFTPSANRTVGL